MWLLQIQYDVRERLTPRSACSLTLVFICNINLSCPGHPDASVPERASKEQVAHSALIHLLRHTLSRLGDLLSCGLHSLAVFGRPFLLQHLNID